MLGYVSCSNSGTKKEKTSDKKERQSDKINDCDDFLAHYEEWIDEYINVIDDYLKNPSDKNLGARYMELMQEGMEWSTKWIALVDCANNEEYEKRFEEISSEVENKLKELGL